MKRRVMRNWLIFLFVLGLVVGWVIPMNFWDVTREAARKPLQAGFYDIGKRMGQLDQQNEFFKFMVLGESDTGKVTLLRIDDKVPMHVHNKENHFVYIIKGRLRATISNVTNELGPGQMLVVPAGFEHSVENAGGAPVEALLFSTPVAEQQDTVWLDKKE